MSAVVSAYPTQPSLCGGDHYTTSHTAYDPTQAISDALWSMKSGFERDPTLASDTRSYLESCVGDLMGRKSATPFTVPDSRRSVMKSLQTAVAKARPCLANILSLVPPSRQSEAHAMLIGIYETIIDKVTANNRSLASSRSSTGNYPRRNRTKPAKSVSFATPPYSPSPSASAQSSFNPSQASVFPEARQMGGEAHEDDHMFRELTLKSYTQTIPASDIPSTAPSVCTPASGPRPINQASTFNQLTVPPRSILSRRLTPRGTKHRAAQETKADRPSTAPDTEGLMDLDAFCEAAGRECFVKTGHYGGWQEAGRFARCMVYDPSTDAIVLRGSMAGMFDESGGLKNFDGIDPLSWGTDRLRNIQVRSRDR